MKIDLSISLISYKNRDLLENCLNSIYINTKNINFEVMLVDNASHNGTEKMIRERFPRVKFIQNRKNLLFTKAHNQNLKRVKGRYFLVLNEDTLIPPKTLENMVKFMDKNPQVGLSSCRHVDEFNKTDNTCSKLPHPILEVLEGTIIGKFLRKLSEKKTNNILKNFRYGNWKRDSLKEVDVIPGSFFMGRTELLHKVGYFDEKLLLFYEEADFCQRAKFQGFTSYHVGTLKITHLQSKAIAKLPAFRRYQISEHDLLYYYRKYFGSIWWIIIWTLTRPDWLYWKVKTMDLKK